jgi:hypothetical protein
MTPTPEQFDEATITLIFALRDSLTPDGPSRLDFWAGRATSAIETAAAGSSDAHQAITTACRKLQIPTLTADASTAAVKAAAVIDADYEAWAGHIARTIVYIVALANASRPARKPKLTNPSRDLKMEIPFR